MMVAVPRLVLDGELVEGLLTRQVLLRQRRPLVGQLLLVGQQGDGPVEVVVAQSLCGLGAGETATDDDEMLGRGHSGLLIARRIELLVAQLRCARHVDSVNAGTNRAGRWFVDKTAATP